MPTAHLLRGRCLVFGMHGECVRGRGILVGGAALMFCWAKGQRGKEGRNEGMDE